MLMEDLNSHKYWVNLVPLVALNVNKNESLVVYINMPFLFTDKTSVGGPFLPRLEAFDPYGNILNIMTYNKCLLKHDFNIF